MYRITKEFTFSASHQLRDLPEGHKCSRLHGHNYIVRLVLEADVPNAVGFVRDYGDLDEFKRWLDDTVDHRHLNDLAHFATPYRPTSAENIARWLFGVWCGRYPELAEVAVSETSKTWATYRP